MWWWLPLVVLAAACANETPLHLRPLPEPDVVEESGTTTTEAPRLAEVPLPEVRGATPATTVAVLGGDIQIVGRVEGPSGPVAGAQVRLERMVGDSVGALVVPTAADGTWNVTGVHGGRYRFRAWRSPDVAMVTAQVVFIEQGRKAPVILEVADFTAPAVDVAVAPSPPPIREPVELAVRVARRSVDANGVVRAEPLRGFGMDLSGTGAWTIRSSDPAFSDSSGVARWTLECRREGEQPLSVTVGGATLALSLPPCVDTTPVTSSSTSSSSSTTTTTTAR